MVRKEIEMLIDKWTNDTGFRVKMRKDPMGTITSAGIQLTPEEMNTFRKIDWKMNDEELKTRATKAA